MTKKPLLLAMVVLVSLAAVIAMAGVALADQEQKVTPQSIIVNPQPSGAFQVKVWTDRGSNGVYNVGEPITIYFQVTRDSYVTIYDINAAGQVSPIFPNQYETNNFARANVVYQIPSRGYQLQVTPPAGNGYVQAVATSSPDVLRLDLSLQSQPGGVGALKGKLQAVLQGIVPSAWASAYAAYQVRDGHWFPNPPRPRIQIDVRTWQSDIQLYLDGVNVGRLPYTFTNITPGEHQLVALKAGYRAWVKDFRVRQGQDLVTDYWVVLDRLD